MEQMINYSNWIHILEKAEDELQNLCISSEHDFLSTGEKLQDYYLRTQEMTEIASSVTNSMLSSEFNEAISGLHNLLEKINYYLNTSNQDMASSKENLNNIRNKLNKLKRPLSDFKKIVKMLTMMGISTKIENARLSMNDSGFDSLADDIKNLSSNIKAKTSDIIDEVSNVSDTVGKTLSNLQLLENRQKSDMKIVLDKAGASISQLNDMNNNSSIAAENISNRMGEILSNIGDVVSSIQFHDITRQQMEHVIKALNDIKSWLNNKNTSGSGESELLYKIKYICELEIAQLDNSMNEFVSAVNTIINSLRAISKNIANMSKDIQILVGDVNKAGGSFLTDIEKGISFASKSLLDSVEATAELSNSMKLSAENVSKLSVFVNDIAQTGLKIELIALNAQIKAAHTGNMGATLGSIAESIQQVSIDSRTHTKNALELLKDIADYSKEIFVTVNNETEEKNSGVQAMIEELKHLIETINLMNKNVVLQINKLDELRVSLVKDIEKTSSGISVHIRIGEILKDIIKKLKEIISSAKAYLPEEEISLKQSFLDDLKKRYTMASEHKIHLTLGKNITETKFTSNIHKKTSVPSKIKSSGKKISPAIGKKETHMDENIELFRDNSEGNVLSDDNIELFGDSNIELFDNNEEDMGDNVELF